ncbi:Nitrate reductase [NADH] 1 [Trametes pubescens]|uniref:Nitrate reductase [NADPH] n=1 Tax=Trametes pubescens TaxID=154538 RepID=A0A1M2W3Y2_TRAPU|nr:Nitrate reductase [NADH] 1 [Trametes pubescens]
MDTEDYSPVTSKDTDIATKRADNEGVDWREKLKSDNTFASIRDVKNASAKCVIHDSLHHSSCTDGPVIRSFKDMYPRNHAFARYVLPATESEIKEQEWPGKRHDDKTPPSTTTSASSISSGVASSDEQKSGEEEHETEDESKEPELSDEQRIFINKLLAEMDMVASFKNNPGRPTGELKLLDHDALRQLESRVSIDDQYATLLHYVRSHGAVPQLTWETHTLSVFSDPPEIIAKPKDWTMDALSSGNFKVVEMPITFGCDGNRRKEMNMIKKTSAFHWSAASVSTCVWRGVLVRDVLLACDLQDQPDEERWYLNFAGADEPSEGPYETSIPLMHAMNPANDVMLVFGMNGRILHPDHGYPLRLIIPGYVGGRQVKWLKKIWVTKEPNRSHYHIWDNRVVPSFIDSRDHPYANAFFHHESTACWEQALQSVIVKPAHDECIPLSGKGCLDATYLLEGYAFGGGGDRVERVELSLDDGNTWKYCFRRFTDAPLRHGENYWAWIFWSCEVKVQELIDAYEIIVRAQDSRKNYQPENISWNLMGMMNNAWYRVRHRVVQDEETALPVLQFQHPVAPGNDEGGWMKPPKVEESAPKQNDKLKTFSLEEISKHSTKDDAWLILDNKVYDVTSVLSWHPGGANAILSYAGKATVDVTNEYKGIHDNYANGKRDECLIGMLSDEGIKAMEEDAVRAAKELAKIKAERHGAALQPDVFTLAKLVARKELSSDTRVYTFELPRKKDGSPGVLGLPVGRHVQIAVHFKDQAVLRSYTPTRPVLPSEEDGTFDLLVKT